MTKQQNMTYEQRVLEALTELEQAVAVNVDPFHVDRVAARTKVHALVAALLKDRGRLNWLASWLRKLPGKHLLTFDSSGTEFTLFQPPPGDTEIRRLGMHGDLRTALDKARSGR